MLAGKTGFWNDGFIMESNDKQQDWQWLKKKLEPRLQASDNEFVEISSDEIIARAKKRYLQKISKWEE